MADQDLPVIAKFAVRRRAYIAPDGGVLSEPPNFASDQGVVVSMYRAMALARSFDLKAVSLQRTGRLGTYATSLGQEAVGVRHCKRHATGRRASSQLSRQRRAAVARSEDGGNPSVLGWRRAR